MQSQWIGRLALGLAICLGLFWIIESTQLVAYGVENRVSAGDVSESSAPNIVRIIEVSLSGIVSFIFATTRIAAHIVNGVTTLACRAMDYWATGKWSPDSGGSTNPPPIAIDPDALIQALTEFNQELALIKQRLGVIENPPELKDGDPAKPDTSLFVEEVKKLIDEALGKGNSRVSNAVKARTRKPRAKKPEVSDGRPQQD